MVQIDHQHWSMVRTPNFGGRNTPVENPVRSAFSSSTGTTSETNAALAAFITVWDIHNGSAPDWYQSRGRLGSAGKISQARPLTEGHTGSRLNSAALVGVLCNGAAIDCASGVHMGAGIRAPSACLPLPKTTSRNDSIANSRDTRRGAMVLWSGRVGIERGRLARAV